MLFNSWTFIVFLLVVFVGYYFGPSWLSRTAAGQTGWLTLASFVFYGWHTPWLVLLLALSTFVNAEAGRRLLDPDASPPQRRRVVAAALTFNLGALAFFKYAALFARLVLPAALWERWKPFVGSIPLPIGISFYTFQGISLVMDLYRAAVKDSPLPQPPSTREGEGRQAPAVESGAMHRAPLAGMSFPRGTRETLWFQQRTWFFKSFFPQLISGPIVKAHEFFHQIGRKQLRNVDWNGAVKHLVGGFFLKMVVADNLKEMTAGLKYPLFLGEPKLALLLLLYGFSFQIFADFCGYSMIAIGLGKLFGYELPINFRCPYISRSMTEFWKRWHISLSTWLRSYLYIPLGGNRHGAARTYFNLFLVMFLGGLWHGAAWSYAVWGTAHGILLAFERMIGIGREKPGKNVLDSREEAQKTQKEKNARPQTLRSATSPLPQERESLGHLRFFAANPGFSSFLRHFAANSWTVLRVFIVFNVVSVLWLLFKLPDFRHVIAYVNCLIHNPSGVRAQSAFVIVLFSMPVVLMHLWAAAGDWRQRLPAKMGKRAWGWAEPLAYAAMLWLIVVNSGTPGEFIYFQF